MHIKLFFKNHRKGLIATVVLILLYILIFEVNFFFDPLRNKPDTIEVYKYGEKYEYHNTDKPFNDIYKLLRNYSKGTISNAGHGISTSYVWDSNLPEKYMNDGVAVRIIYNQVQQDSMYHENYNILVFLLCNNKYDYSKDGPPNDYYVHYATFEKLDKYAKPNNRDIAYSSIIVHFPYPKKLEKYVANNIP